MKADFDCSGEQRGNVGLLRCSLNFKTCGSTVPDLRLLVKNSGSHLSQVEEEAGVLSGLRQVGQEHGDADQ